MESTFSDMQNLRIVIFSEHWLSEQEKFMYPLNGFNLVSIFCRETTKRGGVCIYLHESLVGRQVTELMNFGVQETGEVAAVHIGELSMIIIGIYSSDYNQEGFLEVLYNLLSYCEGHFSDSKIIVAGDFNRCFIANKNDAQAILHVFSSFGLRQTIFEYTRCFGGSKSCMDNIFVNFHFDTYEVFAMVVSDHDAQIIQFKVNPGCHAEQKVVYKRYFDNDNLRTMIYYLTRETWSGVYNCLKVEVAFEAFFNTFMFHFQLSHPLVRHKYTESVNHSNLKWKTLEVQNMKQTLQLSYESYKQLPTAANKSIYNECKLVYNRMLTETKRAHNLEAIQNSDNKTKSLWSVINYETGKSLGRPHNVSSLNADLFNTYFIDSVENIIKELPILADITSNSSDLHNSSFSIFLKPVTPDDIRLIILRLKNKKTEDVYGLSSYFVKKCSQFLIEPLSYIVNLCLTEGTFPSLLKRAKVVPCFKSGDTQSAGSYRPVSILPTFSKIFELIIFDQIMGFLTLHNLISKNQYGFQKGLSTVDAVLQLVKVIYEAFEKKTECCTIFTDLSKAFDSISHQILLQKMQSYGLRGQCLRLVASYLEDRMQQVCYNGTLSTEAYIKRGVPQGSILGPLLFLIYINDLPHYMEKYHLTTILYADDASFTVTKQHGSDFNTPQQIVTYCNQWFTSNQLFLNTQKTVLLDFSLTNTTNNQIDSTKFLGIHLDSKLSFEKHINQLCKKLSSAVYAIRKITRYVGREAGIIAYYALFQSRLAYGLAVWGRAADCHLRKIFIIQKYAIRSITGSEYRAHCRPLFESLGIMSLYSLIVYSDIGQVCEEDCHIQHCDLHTYDTRGKSKLVVPQHRLSKTAPRAVKLFNLLPENIRTQDYRTLRSWLRGFLTENCLYGLEEFNLDLISKVNT